VTSALNNTLVPTRTGGAPLFALNGSVGSLMTKISAIGLLLVTAPTMAGDFPLACVYAANEPTAELEPHAGCAARTKGGLQIATEHLNRMSFVHEGLAAALIDNQWRYVKRNGESLRVLTYDNYADDFSEGLTRSLVGSRIAYFDRDFHQVIPPIYDWGWPFKDGRAMVCLGCKVAERDSEGHRPVIGGKWGFIDKRGREIISVSLSEAEAMKQ
jgi:hypothetical protein